MWRGTSVKLLPTRRRACVRACRQTDGVYEKLVEHVDSVASGAQISLGGPANIRLIGSDVEVDAAATTLRQLCGVVLHVEAPDHHHQQLHQQQQHQQFQLPAAHVNRRLLHAVLSGTARIVCAAASV